MAAPSGDEPRSGGGAEEERVVGGAATHGGDRELEPAEHRLDIGDRDRNDDVWFVVLDGRWSGPWQLHRATDQVEHGGGVVAEAPVPVPLVAVGHAGSDQPCSPEGADLVEDGGGLDGGGTEGAARTDHPGPMPTMITSAPRWCLASVSADGTVTASRSPPKA